MMEVIKTHSVYGLIDPRTQKLFYVGYSCNVGDRISQHNTTNGCCRTVDVVRELGELDLRAEHCIIGEFESKKQALELESKLIVLLPDIVNGLGRASLKPKRPRLRDGKGPNPLRSRPWKPTPEWMKSDEPLPEGVVWA